MNEAELERLEQAFAAEIKEVRSFYARQLSDHAKAKLAEVERTVTESNQRAKKRYEESMAKAEEYRAVSVQLGNTSIEFARNQYRRTIEDNQKILAAFKQMMSPYIKEQEEL